MIKVKIIKVEKIIIKTEKTKYTYETVLEKLGDIEGTGTYMIKGEARYKVGDIIMIKEAQ